MLYKQRQVLILLCFFILNLCCCSEKDLKKEKILDDSFVEQNVINNDNKNEQAVVQETNAKEEVQKYMDKNQKKNENNVKEHDKKEKYKLIVDKNFEKVDGIQTYGVNIYDLNIRFTNESKKMKSASVIKLFIMEYAYSAMEKKEITSETILSGRKLSELIESMITVSDNEATNVLIDYFTMKKLNEFFAKSGYSDTVLGRRMLDTSAAARGEENYTSVNDVMKFLDKLYYERNDKENAEMLEIMKRQKISTKLRRDMPNGVEIASKSGELSDVQNDAGIVFSEKGNYAIVFLSQNGDTSTVQNAMAKTCKEIYEAL